jgi:hypothetical protein
MAELLLDLAFIGIAGCCEVGVQGVPCKFPPSVSHGEIPAHAGSKRGALYEAHDVIAVEAVGAGLLGVLCHPVEQRPCAMRARLSHVCSATIGLM